MRWFFLLFLVHSSLIHAKPKIVVVGAGLSGLTSAWRLHQQGFDVDVYEARQRVGGRVFTVFLNGDLLELGAQNLRDGGESKNLLALIEELGLKTEHAQISAQMHFLNEGKVSNFNEFIESYPKEGLKERLEEITSHAKNMKEVLDELLGSSHPLYSLFKARLEAYEGASIDVLSPFYWKTLYYQLLGGICSAHPATSEKTIDFEWVKGGNGLITEALKEKLGHKVHLDMPLRGISKSNRFTLTFRNGERVEADIVILTIPCPVYKNIEIAENVLPKKKKEAIASIENGENAKVVVPLPPGITPFASTNGHLIAFKSTYGRAITLYYLGPFSHFNSKTIQTLLDRDLPYLEKCYTIGDQTVVTAKDQAFCNYSTAVGHSWLEDPYALGSYSFVAAGKEELFTSTTEIEGTLVKTLFAPYNDLYFAGEHASTLFDVCGTMEAAVESGEKVAKMISAKEELLLLHR